MIRQSRPPRRAWPRFFVWTGMALLAGTSAVTYGATYVGAAQCKLCHRDVHESWTKTPHARAMDSIGAVSGSERGRCLGCHATRGPELPGVQCEACHGPGSDYSPPEVMIDPEKAVLAGLARPAIALCGRCHENEEPGHRGSLAVPPRSEWRSWVHQVSGRE